MFVGAEASLARFSPLSDPFRAAEYLGTISAKSPTISKLSNI